MRKAEYWQRGEAIDYKNTTDTKIEANTIIAFGGHIGVAGTDIIPGELGSLHVTGVFEMPKTANEAIEMGTTVYFDGAGITAEADDGAASDTVTYPLAGYAVQNALAADTVILVKLCG